MSHDVRAVEQFHQWEFSQSNDYSAWPSAKEGCEFLPLLVTISSSLSKSSSKFLIKKKSYLLASVKLRNEQVTVNFVTEVIVLLLLPVIPKILVLCGTVETWWVLCRVVLTLQSIAFICSITRVGAEWVKAGGACVHTWYAYSSSGIQLMNQAGRMWKLGSSEPCFPWHRHSFWHSVRECVIVIVQKFELPEEQKGGRFQRQVCSAVFVVDIIACSVQEVQH